MRADIVPGGIFPDYELPDHTGTMRKLSELQGDEPTTQAMTQGERLRVGSAVNYSASVPTSRAVADYTPRLVPRHVGAFVPLEAPFILWHETPS